MPHENFAKLDIRALSGSVSMLSVVVGIWLSLRQYRLKLRVERCHERSAEIEAEIRLHNLFIELMDIAKGPLALHQPFQ